MNKGCIIRTALVSDIEKIMFFIKQHWSEKHILANSREFFEYQHRIDEENVSFIVAEDRETRDFKAVLGYIMYGIDMADIMLALWKSIDETNPFLGVQLLEYITKTMKFRIVACCGINKKVVRIYQFMGYHTGALEHYYRLANKEEYKLAVVNKKDILAVSANDDFKLIEYVDFSDLEKEFSFSRYKEQGAKPYKEAWYIKKRYFDHPVYWYRVFGIKNSNNEIKTVLFAREQECSGVKILRFVDLIGDLNELKHISQELNRLIRDGGYEYADFYQHGIPKEIMNEAGFSLKTDGNNIIPNYFEPYVPENIEILYSTMDDDGFLICKGDGDQDRPNFFVKRVER